MQTQQYLCNYLLVDIAKIAIEYLKSKNLSAYGRAKNGFYEECLNIERQDGLAGAIDGNHIHIVRLMVQAGAIIESHHIENACCLNTCDILEYIIHVNISGECLQTCLRNVCYYGSADVFAFLFKMFGQRCLSHIDNYINIICANDDFDKMNIVLSQDQTFNISRSIQYYATRCGYLKVVKLIYEHSKQNGYELDWFYLSCIAYDADMLKYTMSHCVNVPNMYDRIFNMQMHVLDNRTLPKIKLLIPHVKSKTLGLHMSKDNIVQKHVACELFARACRVSTQHS